MIKSVRFFHYAFRVVAVAALLLVFKTVWDVRTPDLSQHAGVSDASRFQVLDRRGQPIGISYQNAFNTMDIVPLHTVPELLRRAFVTSEDRHFFEHHGVDMRARISAIGQNIHAGKAVRGASTITEQVVRILHPRPRTLWSRWVEGFEAMLLELRTSKGDILEFYLNQVPYAANRRGVAQAARYYFNRDLDTLTHKEMLALAVLPRAPSTLDLYKSQETIEPSIMRLAQAMIERGELTAQDYQQIAGTKMVLEPPGPPLNATHFINYIRETVPYQLSEQGAVTTTLDSHLQSKAQDLLDERLKSLARKHIQNGAILIADHTTGEILAWAVAGAGDDAKNQKRSGKDIDAVRVPRQPGSSLKPFLYALALDAGWSPATELNDAPMAEAIGSGLHDFHNYSHIFYGKISLREALGNSLNIPALETIAYIGPSRYLDALQALGITSLTQPVEFYKEGLALGNGEISLFEMVQAYCTLANRGVFRPLTPLVQAPFARDVKRVYSEEATSLIGNILSDSFARRREFGGGSVLNLPVQTAVKTGTSSDYRDAWVFGFNSRYVVGVWFGNLDQVPMDGITGSTGPALTLRGLFATLTEHEKASPLYLSPKLVQKEICSTIDNTLKSDKCFPRTEYFIPGTEPKEQKPVMSTKGIALVRPTEGLQIAYDPRIRASNQAFEFVTGGVADTHGVEWILNGKPIANTPDARYLWAVERGHYTLEAREVDNDRRVLSTDSVHFNVK